MQSKKSSKKKSPAERKNTKIVVDCSTLAYAAYYSYGHLSYNNEPTGVIFGFLSKMLLIAETFQTNSFIFCWDSETELLREQDYKGYKEKRRNKELTEEEKISFISIHKQRDELRNSVLPRMGFRNSFIADGFEADDLLAVYSIKLAKRFPVVMVTTDYDMFQCLNCCSIYNPSKKTTYTLRQFKEEFRIDPNQWAMAKAIGGCDSDNVKGIQGISDPKKPTSKSLKYLRGELTKGKVLAKIEGSEGQTIIKRNLPIVTTPYKPEKLSRAIFRRDNLTIERFISIFEIYGCYSFLKRDKLNKWRELFL